jgi:hypothetical protein
MLVLLEGVTLGTLSQDTFHPAMGYVAFATLAVFLIAVTLLPGARMVRSAGVVVREADRSDLESSN